MIRRSAKTLQAIVKDILLCVVLEHVAHQRHCVMRYINVLLTYLLVIVKSQTRRCHKCGYKGIATKKLKHAHIHFSYLVAGYLVLG